MEEHRVRGYTKDEWISSLHEDVEIDNYPFGHILMWGRDDFKLEGQELENFIRDSLIALLKAGAFPLDVERKKGMLRFVPSKEYGTDPQEIVDNIMTEWREKGEDNYTDENYPFTCPWFGITDSIWRKEQPKPILDNSSD